MHEPCHTEGACSLNRSVKFGFVLAEYLILEGGSRISNMTGGSKPILLFANASVILNVKDEELSIDLVYSCVISESYLKEMQNFTKQCNFMDYLTSYFICQKDIRHTISSCSNQKYL